MRPAGFVLILALAACGGDSGTAATTVAPGGDTTTSTGGGTTLASSGTTVGGTVETVTTATTAPVTTSGTQPATGTSVVVTMVGTTMVEGPALTVTGDVYTMNWEALTGPVVFTPAGGGLDPFFLVHNSPAHDGFFFSVEAHTVYGAAWTGQLGTFEIGCSPAGTGICVAFDPDGPGPLPDLGADNMVTGTIEILQADAAGFIAVFSNVSFSDGSTIPGPFTVSG